VGRYLKILDGQAPTAEGMAASTTRDQSDQSEGTERLRSLLSLLSPPNPNEEPRATRAFVPIRLETTTDVWSDAEEERAAMVEYDGGAPRAWAEALARLDPTRPPRDMSAKRWLRFIDDCGRFLDDGWAARAAAFGWEPLHLFGCDRNRWYARLDHLGLLWRVNGGRMVELHRDRAIIELKSGARHCFRCRRLEVGRAVLAWELAQ
jgi:hypothetical protein